MGMPQFKAEEDKQRAKIKEKIDKFVKEKLLDFCDVLNIQINKTNVKKEEGSTKLLEYLESPHATTKILLADKEQKGKKRTRKSFPSKSPGKASTETPAKWLLHVVFFLYREVASHSVALLSKHQSAWFRELPTGVLDPLSLEQVMQSQSEEECAQLMRLLPPTEATLLDWAINLMANVAQMENLNNMNARNIAMVFAPNMTQVDVHSNTMQAYE
ncbi:hypothetical protein JHK86_027673 [Glycine max]|nr:hypothetical protein JHK86_027673 [Glycine max]